MAFAEHKGTVAFYAKRTAASLKESVDEKYLEARASGIPTRDVYGLRVDPAKSGEITGSYHCWTEFYLPGTGWVMADPEDAECCDSEYAVDVLQTFRSQDLLNLDEDSV